MGNGKRYAKFQENLFSGDEIKSILCPPLFRKRHISFAKDLYIPLATASAVLNFKVKK